MGQGQHKVYASQPSIAEPGKQSAVSDVLSKLIDFETLYWGLVDELKDTAKKLQLPGIKKVICEEESETSFKVTTTMLLGEREVTSTECFTLDFGKGLVTAVKETLIQRAAAVFKDEVMVKEPVLVPGFQETKVVVHRNPLRVECWSHVTPGDQEANGEICTTMKGLLTDAVRLKYQEKLPESFNLDVTVQGSIAHPDLLACVSEPLDAFFPY